ncbi:hypothetical protein TI39_contig4273g00006 [Zymoseptoria brevis]|uniref:DUF6697 domain-containing protein n=1 Tax=Zymoseptoria brevis TaxID=1047168 RepID=A0A0F4GBV8_9PEZI|nr:hypothetical protein TI39_contig4273g00006 [Zymoseptoria brevis]
MVSPNNIGQHANGTLDQNNRFNPTVQNFQPNLSHPDNTALTKVTASGDFTSSRSYSVETCNIDYEIRKNSFEIAELRKMTENDMLFLHDEVRDLKLQLLQAKRCPPHMMSNFNAGVYALDGSFAPSVEMRGLFSDKALAKSWLDDADTCDRTSLRLREQAKKLLAVAELSPAKMIEAAPTTVNGGREAHEVELFCCKAEFSDADSVIEHVHSVHAKPQLMIVPESHPKAVAIKSEGPIDGEPEECNEARPAISTLSPLTSPAWTPYAVSQMGPVSLQIPASTTTFPRELLDFHFHGDQWSPGFHFIKGDSVLPSKSYWLLNTPEEPFLPSSPGQHGAKLTPFFNETLTNAGDAPDEDNYKGVPLFIQSADPNDPGFRYFGHYSQLRYSDTVGYDTLMNHVPDSVRHYWAGQLSDRARPEWVTKKLMQHFWPKPVYDGPVTNSDASDSAVHDGRVKRALEEYAEEVAEWEKEAKMKVNMLSEQNIFDSFASADADAEPGLRLWWEYMECVAWDEKFYDMLVELKARHEKAFVNAKGQKIVSGPPSDTFILRTPKPATKLSPPPPKNAGTDLCHPNGSARWAFNKQGHRQALPEHPNGSQPATKLERIMPAGPKNGTVVNGDRTRPPHEQHRANSVTAHTNGEVKTEGNGEKNGYYGTVGDLEAAKKFSDDVTRAGRKKSVAPHLRGR